MCCYVVRGWVCGEVVRRISRPSTRVMVSSRHSSHCTGEEGTALCNILADRHGGWGARLRGDILINGNSVGPARLADR